MKQTRSVTLTTLTKNKTKQKKLEEKPKRSNATITNNLSITKKQ